MEMISKPLRKRQITTAEKTLDYYMSWFSLHGAKRATIFFWRTSGAIARWHT